MTFNNTPADYSSVNDNLVYVVYDAKAADPTTYPNYKYVGELFINGTKQFTAKVFPRPETNFGIFDFGNIVREYVDNILTPSTGINAQTLGEGAWRLSVVVKIKEEVNGTVSSILLTDSLRVFYNHYNGRINGFTLLADYTNKVLSNRPVNLEVYFSAKYLFVPYFALSGSSFTVVIGANTKTITPTANTSILLNISPDAINSEYSGTITADTESYSVVIAGVTYNVKVVCSKLYKPYMVHFLNKYGVFESMIFNKARKRSVEFEKATYQQLPYRVDGSGVASVKTGNIMHQQKTDYAKSFTEKIKINTDLLGDQEHEWLGQLVSSPMVYLEDSATLYPVVISQTNYEFKEHVVDGLQNLALELEFGTSYNTQFK